eukprot:COSAG01_NODE_4598_length_4887_cov_8.259816_5_plen_213_part_00
MMPLLAVLRVAGVAALELSVDVTNVSSSRVSRLWMGCHSDLGFAQTPCFYSANMLHEPAFGYGTRGCATDDPRLGLPMSVPPWFVRSATRSEEVGTVTRHWVCPTTTDSVLVRNSTVTVNRGVGGVGLFLEAGLPYELELYVHIYRGKAAGPRPQLGNVSFFAELRDSTRDSAVLARQTIDLTTFDTHVYRHHLKLTLTPSQSTNCIRIANR